MAISTVPVAKAGLLALLVARAPLTGKTWWSYPGNEQAGQETVYLAAVEFTQEAIATMRTAPHVHRENYVVPVHVEVLQEGNDPQAAETRMWALVAEVEDAVRLNTTLGLSDAVVTSAVVTDKRPFEYESDMGRAMHCRIAVSVQARSA